MHSCSILALFRHYLIPHANRCCPLILSLSVFTQALISRLADCRTIHRQSGEKFLQTATLTATAFAKSLDGDEPSSHSESTSTEFDWNQANNDQIGSFIQQSLQHGLVYSEVEVVLKRLTGQLNEAFFQIGELCRLLELEEESKTEAFQWIQTASEKLETLCNQFSSQVPSKMEAETRLEKLQVRAENTHNFVYIITHSDR